MSYIVALVALVIGVYTGNVGVVAWKDGNRFAAVVIFILAVAAVVVPVLAGLAKLYR